MAVEKRPIHCRLLIPHFADQLPTFLAVVGTEVLSFSTLWDAAGMFRQQS